MRLYKFLDARFAVANLCKQRLKISRIKELNDPFELIAVRGSSPDEREALAKFRDQISELYGIICFSRRWNNPVLWSHYAENHRGVVLGFDVDDRLLLEVGYRQKRIELPRKDDGRAPALSDEFLQQVLSTKFADWSYESEWRLFTELAMARLDSGFFFEEFSEQLALREILLGVRCEISAGHVEDFLKKHGLLANVGVVRMAPDSFELVLDGSDSMLGD